MQKRSWHYRGVKLLLPLLLLLVPAGAMSYRSAADPFDGMAEPPFPADLTKLVGLWNFDAGSGTTAADSSGKGNNGTINGATWVDSDINEWFENTVRSGEALLFDGINDVVTVPTQTSLNITDEITIEAWANPHGLGQASTYRSCAEILQRGGSVGNGIYSIDPDGTGGSSPFQVYCDMTTDGGGWTLIMRANQANFSYDDPLWTNATTYNETSFSFSTASSKAKYAAFATVPVREIRTSDINNFAVNYRYTLSQSYSSAMALFSGSGIQIGTTMVAYFNDRTPADGQEWGCTTYINVGINQKQYLGTGSLPGGPYCDWNGGARFGQRINANHSATGNHAGQGWGSYDTIGGHDANYLITELLWVRDLTVAARSCADILYRGASVGNGTYTIDPDGVGGNDPFQVYCDMTTDGGGWTQIHFITTDTEGNQEKYGEVFSTVDKGTFSSSTSYSRKGRLLLDFSTEFRYTQTSAPWGSNYSSRDVKCLIDQHFRDAIKTPVTQNCGNNGAIVCYNLASANAPISGYSMNNQYWTGNWNMNYARIWIGSDPTTSNYCHGDYPPFGVVTWKLSNSTVATYQAFQSGSVAVAFWVRDSGSNYSGYAVNKGNAYGLKAVNRLFGGLINGNSLTTATPDGLNHLVMTYNKNGGSNNFRLYVNGNLKAQSTLTDTIATTSENLLFGSGFSGLLDNIAIYNSALTGSEVSQRYQQFAQGLVARYKFDRGFGATAIDSSGNELSATLKNGVQWVRSTVNQQYENADDSGNALAYDGVNDVVEVADNNLLDFGTTDFSAEAWLYVDPASLISNKEYGIINKNSYFQNAPGWGMEISTWTMTAPFSAVSVHSYNSGQASWCSTCASSTLTVNRWHHVVTTRQGSTLRLYIDGQLKNERTHADVALTTNNSLPLQMGLHAWGPNAPIRLDEVSLYTRAFDPWEIRRRYERASLGLIAKWNFDEGSGSSASDSSDYGRSATLNGGAGWTSSDLGTAQGGAPTGSVLTLNGTNSYVQTPLIINGSQSSSLTALVWVKFNSTTKYWHSLLDAYGGPGGARNFQMWLGSDQKVYIYHNGEAHTGAGSLSPNVWYHLAYSYYPYDSGYLFINGQTVANGTITVPAGTPSNVQLLIGKRTDSHVDSYTNGTVDQVEIYNSALSAQEIFVKANWVRRTGFPMAKISNPANDATFNLNQAITFLTSGSSDSYGQNPGITSYYWDFDDGTPIIKRDSSVTVSYSTPGDKVIKLWVIDNQGNPSLLGLGEGLITIHINSSSVMAKRLDNFSKK